MDILRFASMRIEDLDEVLAIEHASFSTPWSRTAYHRELVTNGYATYLVGHLGDRLVSYGGMWLILDEAHITNIAVHPDFRERGIGRSTLVALEKKAGELGACRITLEVRVSNTAARRLYEHRGYRGTGIRRDYYSDTHEDAIVMWKDLVAGDGGPAETREPAPGHVSGAGANRESSGGGQGAGGCAQP